MFLGSYRAVLRIPDMRLIMLVGLFARIPQTATGTALTLDVVLDRHLGYGAAGAAGAAFTVGLAIASPVLGRAVDRRGARPVLCVTGLGTLAFWATAPLLPFAALLPAATLGGLLMVPVANLVRQTLAVKVPEGQRRQAYSLDSMAVELSFMTGPALAILVITQLGDAASTLRAVGVSICLAAAAMWAYYPHVVDAHTPMGGAPTTRRDWFGPRFVVVLGVGAAATVMLGGAEVAIVASLRAQGQVQWAGIVITCWGAASMAGGFLYGAMRRPPGMLILVALLGAATVPVGLAHDWPLLALALIPSGLVTAPTIAQTVAAVSFAVPESARGEAIGMHGSALTLGNAVGAPLAGAVIDHSSPAFGFAVVGLAGAASALAVMGVVTVRGAAGARVLLRG